MNSKQHDQDDLDAAVAAATPYPQAQVDDLSVGMAGHDLMETIMTTEPRPTRTALTDAGSPIRPTRRFVTPVLAAAAVTAIVVGSLALRDGSGDAPGEEAAPASSGATTTSATGPAPSLAPRGDNLFEVVLTADDWQVTNLDQSTWGGNLSWTHDDEQVEMNWYRAEDYPSYLADRREIGPAEKIELLGQEGEAFTYPKAQQGDPVEMGVPLAKKPSKGDDGTRIVKDPELPDGTRTMVILPPVGDWFLEFDVTAEDARSVESLLESLRRVPHAEWLAALDDTTVQPAEAEEFLKKVSQGVPMPDGLEVEPGDLDLPQSAYHARIAFISPVVCAWAEDYLGGDEEALEVLRSSKDWSAVTALEPDGDYGSALAESVELLAKDRNLDNFRQAVC